MSALRVAAIVGTVAVNVLLAGAPPRAALAWVHPVAPPLTHIPEMGEAVLGAAPSPPPPPAPPPGAQGMYPGGPPPLRGLAGAVEQVARASGTPEQQFAVAQLRAVDQEMLPHARRARTLRLAVQADAIALAEALGPARVGRIVARKDALSTEVGEGRAWAEAIERVAP